MRSRTPNGEGAMSLCGFETQKLVHLPTQSRVEIRRGALRLHAALQTQGPAQTTRELTAQPDAALRTNLLLRPAFEPHKSSHHRTFTEDSPLRAPLYGRRPSRCLSHLLCFTTTWRRMRDTYAPLSVELHSQPQAASMSTSSQYYRSASAHSHYQNLTHSDHGQLYALPAWQQQPDHASFSGPSPAPFPHFAQGGAESVSQPASAAQTWSPGYARQEHQLWTPSEDENFPSRSGNPYTAVEGYASVPQPNLDASRQYQHHPSLTTRHDIASSIPGHSFLNAERFHYHRTPSVGAHVVLALTRLMFLGIPRNRPSTFHDPCSGRAAT